MNNIRLATFQNGKYSFRIASYATESSAELLTKDIAVPQSALGIVIGKNGSKLKSLEAQYKVSIKIPARDTSDPVRVTGAEADVDKAIKIIQVLSKPREDYTHFVAIPMTGYAALDEAVKELHTFAKDIDPAIKVGSNRLHLTLFMLSLKNRDAVYKATDTLEKFGKQLKSVPRISIGVKGVELMKGTPKEAHVLYAGIEANEELNSIIQQCIDAYKAEGLIPMTTLLPTLHMTLINTVYGRVRKPFDAQSLLDEFKDREFGSVSLQRIQLLAMKREKSGAYVKETEILILNAPE